MGSCIGTLCARDGRGTGDSTTSFGFGTETGSTGDSTTSFGGSFYGRGSDCDAVGRGATTSTYAMSYGSKPGTSNKEGRDD